MRSARSLALLIGCALLIWAYASGRLSTIFQPKYGPAQASRGIALAAPRFDRWQIIGPGGGGALYSAAISPLDARLRLIACDMGGSYITHDGGVTWRQFDLFDKSRFAFDPHDGRVLFAYSNRFLFRSRDSGETWEVVWPAPAKMTKAAFIGEDGVLAPFTDQGVADLLHAFAIDPLDGDRWYAAIGQTAQVTTDAGKTWRWIGPLHDPLMILVEHESPQSRVLFIERDAIAEYSERRGFLQHPAIQQDGSVLRIRSAEGIAGAFRGHESAVYVAVEKTVNAGALLVTHDYGATWTTVDAGLTSQLSGDGALVFPAVAVPEGQPEEVFVSYKGAPSTADRHFGVAHSSDGGLHWTLVWKQADKPSPSISDAWITPELGGDWGESPESLSVSKTGRQLLAGDFGRCLKSDDAGSHWSQCYSHTLDDGSSATTGIDSTTSYGVHFDPFDRNRAFISYTDIGLFRTDNGGDGWVRSMQGVPRRWRNTAYWMDLDPAVKGRAWVALSSLHDLPWARSLKLLGHAKGGVMITDNGGRSWRQQGDLPEAAYTHVLIDRTSPPSQRVLYAAALGIGVFRSDNGGNLWHKINSGLPDHPLAWRLTLSFDHTLYLVVARRSDDPERSQNWGAVYKSTDDGEHWLRLSSLDHVSGPMTLAISPDDPKRLYLAAWGHDSDGAANDNGGVFVSTDGGNTWQNTLSNDQHVYDVTVDDADPNILYAAGFQASVWRSDDRGRTWQRLRGFDFPAAHRVFIDRNDRGKIFVTTFGSSVWHGPAKGDPNAKEDVITPQLQAERLSAARSR